MPDPKRATISATQIPALYNESPYLTRWMLFHWLHGNEVEQDEDGRMRWGKLMQPLLLEEAARELAFEVLPNADDEYVTNGPLGCTRDAVVICPDRGPGALETKCVFDYRQWMQRWAGGKLPPRDIEMQLQAQIAVGNGHTPYSWGIIAVWLAGSMYYFERPAKHDLIDDMRIEAKRFLAASAEFVEPDPFGAAIENPLIAQLFPETKPSSEQVLPDESLAEAAAMYEFTKAEAAGLSRAENEWRAKLLAAAGDIEKTYLPGGTVLTVKKSKTRPRVVTLPTDLRRRLGNVLDELPPASARAVCETIDFEQVVQKPSVRTTIKVYKPETAQDGTETAPPTQTPLMSG